MKKHGVGLMIQNRGDIEMTKKEIITYEDLKFEGSRSFYEGETIDGKRHGKGIMYYGATHDWRDIVFENCDDMKSKYEIDKNKPYENKLSSSIEGNINFSYRKSSLEDEAYIWEIYNGEWKEDIIHGHGTFFREDRSKFVGESKEGSFYKGTLTHPDPYNEKFIGTFKDGHYGEGTLTYNGRQYEGTFKDGYFHKGKLTFTDGRIFTDEFDSGHIVKGTMMFNDGSKYVGEFGLNEGSEPKGEPLGNGRENFTEDDIITGLGILTKADGSKQKGYFIDGKLDDEDELTQEEISILKKIE